MMKLSTNQSNKSDVCAGYVTSAVALNSLARPKFGQMCFLKSCTWNNLVKVRIDHWPYRWLSVGSGLPYVHRSVANTETRFEPNILGRGCFISLRRPVRTASALSGLLIRCLAPNMEDDAVSQKSGSTILKGHAQATGKWGIYLYVQIKHRGRIMPPRVWTCACSFSNEDIPWFSKGRFIKFH